MAADEGKNLGEGIRLVLEELADLKRESLRYFQNADADRKQAAEDRKQADADRKQADADRKQADADRRQADADRTAYLTFIRQSLEVDRLDRRALKATLDTLVLQVAGLAQILERQGGMLGEIRDLLRRGGNGHRPRHGNGHGKS